MMPVHGRWFGSPARPLRSFIRRLVRDDARLLIGLLVVALLILGFVMIADQVLEGGLAEFDRVVLTALRTDGNLADPIGPPWFEEMVRDVTALGSTSVLSFLLVTLVGYFLLIRKRGAALLMTVAVLGGLVVNTVLKIGFGRPRPDIAHTARVFTASFPSAHATLSAITFLTIGVLLARMTVSRHIKVYFMAIAVLLTVLVGLSRVYLGLHYTSDVLAGWIIGSGWAILCWAVALRLQKQGAVEPTGDSGGDAPSKDGTRPD
jgi:undecaprenyl-diphosphatase